MVGDGDAVQSSIIDTKSEPSSVRFWNEEYWRSGLGRGSANLSFL